MAKPYKIGIVLSGGGSKGLAHVGVLRYLEEIGIEIDAIAGTSAGAIVGGLYANGVPPREIKSFFQSTPIFHWQHRGFFSQRQFDGIIDSAKIIKFFKPYFPIDDFSHLKKDLYLVATDLQKGKERVFHGSGPVCKPIMASAAFPLVFSPVTIDDTLYSDGGILNHFPVDVLYGKCEKLIGVFVSPIREAEKDSLHGIQNIVIRAMNIQSTHGEQEKIRYCNVGITSEELINYGTFTTKSEVLHEIYEIGYRAAQQQHDALIKLLEPQEKSASKL
ncbi:patatin-like phospholipase family protein [Persicobacter psychrovividus]|uniref:PNPLA domain-containing protein n=1 Tax=Persicobacter psychrovividus TaxID=387638 RepID=A0ABM7VE45_9BACT|nr:hypothetical protein PEPS_15110 [Persicobacter psychrovividus]